MRQMTAKGVAMHNTYNIYKIKPEKLGQLLAKLAAVGLTEQKTLPAGDYSMTFYYSENIRGNDVWWWEVYREFFNDAVREPKNVFHFALLLCRKNGAPENIYAASLGKSHFYLSRFIQQDFGIQLAVRMADENTILLKKSRYFAGTKRQDVSSYQSFQLGTYEPGESVDHLKLKASNKNIWGDRNIIFADSIQMDMDRSPLDLGEIFNQIEDHITGQEVIRLPKLEAAPEELIDHLDQLLLTQIREMKGTVQIEEFFIYGVAICFNFHDYEYRISCKKPGQAGSYRQDIQRSLDISDIHNFLNEHGDIRDINEVRVQFKNEERGAFTKDLKELLDIAIDHGGYQYFLKAGSWYKFNDTFMTYLKRSLEGIPTEIKDPLNEADYLAWKQEKEARIEANQDVENKITYREYYFNLKQRDEHDFILMDRQLTLIQAMEGKKSYRLEVADLFKDGEITSVKISEDNHELIYNIEQSKDSVELIQRKVIEFEHELTAAALWFVFEDDIQSITNINSIQFLLAVESWRKLVSSYALKPKIYISKHNR